MKEVTYAEFTAFLGQHGWPKAEYEFSKRYEITRYVCIGTFNGVTSSRTAEIHKQMKRGKAVATVHYIPA